LLVIPDINRHHQLIRKNKHKMVYSTKLIYCYIKWLLCLDTQVQIAFKENFWEEKRKMSSTSLFLCLLVCSCAF
jgi:hypothetical protein